MNLKAHWQVSAGLIPGQIMPEYNRLTYYTPADYQTDGGTQEGLQKHTSEFTRIQEDVHLYARQLEASGLNWVKVDYFWY